MSCLSRRLASWSGGIVFRLSVPVHAYLSSLVGIFPHTGQYFVEFSRNWDSSDLPFKLAEAEWFGAHDSLVFPHPRGKIFPSTKR